MDIFDRRVPIRGTIVYSLMLKCRASCIEPLAYLRHVFSELPQRATDADIADLLPDPMLPSDSDRGQTGRVNAHGNERLQTKCGTYGRKSVSHERDWSQAAARTPVSPDQET